MRHKTSISATRRKLLKATGGASLLSAGLSGCLGSRNSGTRTIGIAIPQSGDLADFGDQFARQADFALNFVNESENRIEWDIEDTNTTESDGVTAANKLVNEQGYPMIFAGLSSSVAMAIAESVAIPNNTLMATGGTSAAISDLDDNQYVWRTSPASTFQARAMATLIQNDGNSSVGIIYLNDDFGNSFEEELTRSLDIIGVTVTDSVAYEAGESSYSSQLNEITSGNPDALAFVTFPQSFIIMAKEAFEMGMTEELDYYGVENIKGSDVANNVPAEALTGMKGTQPNPPTERESYQQFLRDNEDMLNNEPSIWEAYYFDAAMLMSLTATCVDSYESEELRETLYEISRAPGDTYNYTEFDDAVEAFSNGESINYEGVATNVDLDEIGDVVGTYRQWSFVNGEFQNRDFIDVADDLS